MPGNEAAVGTNDSGLIARRRRGSARWRIERRTRGGRIERVPIESALGITRGGEQRLLAVRRHSGRNTHVVGEAIGNPGGRRLRRGGSVYAEHAPAPGCDRIGRRLDGGGGRAEIGGKRAGRMARQHLFAIKRTGRGDTIERLCVGLARPVGLRVERELHERRGGHRRADAGGNLPQEQLRRLDSRRQRPRECLAFNCDLQRRRLVIRLGCCAGEGHTLEGREAGSEPRIDWGSRIFGLELAELPLPGQEPERVAHLSAEAPGEVDRARPALEPVVCGDCWRSINLFEHLVVGHDFGEMGHGEVPAAT